jgi:integrase
LQQWADEVIARVSHGNTRDRYSASAKNLTAAFGNVKLSEITAEGIESFQQSRLHQGKHPATVNRDVALLFRLLKLARKRRLILQNPCEEVERLNERRLRRQARPLTYEEEQRLLMHCDALLRIFAITLIETGLRSKKEALPLRWADVDLETQPGCILVRKSKSDAGVRRIWLTEFCRQHLRSWRDFLGPAYSDFVFPSQRDPKVYWTGYQKPWTRAVKKAGLGDRRVYDLRSTFATRANAAHATELTLAHLLGHSSTAILPTYAKAIDENTRAVITRLDAQRAELSQPSVVH